MKLLSGILGLTLTGVATLASASPADFPITPGIDWAGPYAGVNIGGAWGSMSTDDVNGLYFGTPGQTFGNDTAGITGGGQLGYNFQYGSLVIGPEVDLGGADLSGKKWNVPGAISDSMDSGFYADVTGRLGFSVGQGLLYAKGGYVYFSGSESHFDNASTPASTSTTGLSGWTFGGGYEYKITPVWSVKGEYMHSDFGINTLYDTNTATACSTPPSCPIRDGLGIDSVKFGVNYFLNGASVPLK